MMVCGQRYLSNILNFYAGSCLAPLLMQSNTFRNLNSVSAVRGISKDIEHTENNTSFPFFLYLSRAYHALLAIHPLVPRSMRLATHIFILASRACSDLKAFARPHAYLNASSFGNQLLYCLCVLRIFLRSISCLPKLCKYVLQISLASCQEIHQVRCLHIAALQRALHDLPNFRI